MILLESGSGSIEWENDQITYDMNLSFFVMLKCYIGAKSSDV